MLYSISIPITLTILWFILGYTLISKRKKTPSNLIQFTATSKICFFNTNRMCLNARHAATISEDSLKLAKWKVLAKGEWPRVETIPQKQCYS